MESVIYSESEYEPAENWTTARDTLRKWREEDSGRSLRIVELGKYLIEHKKSNLGSEVWSIYEQTFIAALDCGNNSLAEVCIKTLKRQFPDSLRVSILEGLCLEAKEKFNEALQSYDKLLEEHPSCSSVWKRKVAILKNQRKTIEAVKTLNEFLNVFMTDTEAWLELTDLYIGFNDLGRACFCMEELILTNPHHYLYHLKYAEICYTAEHIELAKKHYATAVKLNPCSLRALYGFHLVCQIGTKGRQGDSKLKNSQYADWAKLQIKRSYQFDDLKLRIVEKMLDRSEIH